MNEFDYSVFSSLKVKTMTFSSESLLSAMIFLFKFIMRLIDDDESVNVEKQAENDKIS